MNLEEIVKHLLRMDFERSNARDRLAIHKAVELLETTRWRKLGEEKPTGPGDYEVGCWRHGIWKTCQQSWPPTIYSNGSPSWTEASHWREVIGPKEES